MSTCGYRIYRSTARQLRISVQVIYTITRIDVAGCHGLVCHAVPNLVTRPRSLVGPSDPSTEMDGLRLLLHGVINSTSCHATPSSTAMLTSYFRLPIDYCVSLSSYLSLSVNWSLLRDSSSIYYIGDMSGLSLCICNVSRGTSQ